MGLFQGAEPAARVPFSGVAHLLLPELALTTIVASKLPHGVKLAASIALLSHIVHTLATTSSGDSVDDYTTGSAVLGNTFFNVIFLVWLNNPIQSFSYLRDEDSSPLSSRPFWSRFYATLCISHNNRLVGWNVQVPNVPPSFKGTRAQFLLHRFRQLVVAFMLADISDSICRLNRHRYESTRAGGTSFPPGILGHVEKSCWMANWLVMTYSVLNVYYIFASIVTVAAHASRPEDWPDAFGSWADAYTVRRLWGRTWHQFLRRHFKRLGSLAIDALRIPRGTFLSSQVQVHVAFALSGLIHSFGDLANPRASRAGSFPFFLLNALAITLEDVVIKLAKSLGFTGPTTLTRWLGYAWVVLWVSVSAPVYIDWMYESGVAGKPALPYSPVREMILPWL